MMTLESRANLFIPPEKYEGVFGRVIEAADLGGDEFLEVWWRWAQERVWVYGSDGAVMPTVHMPRHVGERNRWPRTIFMPSMVLDRGGKQVMLNPPLALTLLWNWVELDGDGFEQMLRVLPNKIQLYLLAWTEGFPIAVDEMDIEVRLMRQLTDVLDRGSKEEDGWRYRACRRDLQRYVRLTLKDAYLGGGF